MNRLENNTNASGNSAAQSSGLTPARDWPSNLGWLKQLNTSLSLWAASLSWGRMALLALIVLIAVSWIGETLNLRHEKVPGKAQARKDKVHVVKAAGDKAAGECIGETVRIGGDNGILICEGGFKPALPQAASSEPAAAAPGSLPAASASTAASPGGSAGEPTEAASTPANAASKPLNAASRSAQARLVIDNDNAGDDDERPRRTIRRTFAGWIGDVFSAALIAVFAYLIAAKIMVRKSAEADAKLRVADVKLRSAEGSAEREAVQRQLMQARLKLLQAQVEPHFLFNTLAAVDYLIETDPPRASVMQKALITYLRASLPQMRQASSTLGREIKLIRAYLELLKMRIEERLEFEIEVPQALESAVFPPMVLQSLVENAIQHGIEPKPEGGRISVRASLVQGDGLGEGAGRLRVDVVDTGVGLPEIKVDDLHNDSVLGNAADGTGTGLGLDNIRSRLAMLYPGASRMELRSGSTGGTLVRIHIPYQVDAPASAGPANSPVGNPFPAA